MERIAGDFAPDALAANEIVGDKGARGRGHHWPRPLAFVLLPCLAPYCVWAMLTIPESGRFLEPVVGSTSWKQVSQS